MTIPRKKFISTLITAALLLPGFVHAEIEDDVMEDGTVTFSYPVGPGLSTVLADDDHGISFEVGRTAFSKRTSFLVTQTDDEDQIPPYWMANSPIFDFKLADPATYKGKYFSVDIAYEPSDSTEVFVVWNGTGWERVPASNDRERHTLHANFRKSTAARVAVFTDQDKLDTGRASWYGFKRCLCAASPDYPKGTKLKVTNSQNGKSVTVTVNDWGPERDLFPNRAIDLDKIAFKKIGALGAGTVPVTIDLVEHVD